MSGLFKESISPETVGSILQSIADPLAIGPATRTRAGVLTVEDYIRIQGIGRSAATRSLA